MRRSVVGLVIAGVLGIAAFAEGASICKEVASYFDSRYKDLRDIFSIKLSLNSPYSARAYVRLMRWAQVGFGESWNTKFGTDKCGSAICGEGRAEYALLIPVSCSITRKIFVQNDEAQKRNLFFGDVGKDGVLGPESMKEYYDGNRPWLSSSVALDLPILPGAEATIYWGEAVDFVLGWIPIKGLRVPPPFYKHKVSGSDIPSPEAMDWHGQESLENY